jgi:hypothetical protein
MLSIVYLGKRILKNNLLSTEYPTVIPEKYLIYLHFQIFICFTVFGFSSFVIEVEICLFCLINKRIDVSVADHMIFLSIWIVFDTVWKLSKHCGEKGYQLLVPDLSGGLPS